MDSILDEKIFPILAELELEDGLDIYKKFKRIINRLKEQRKIEMIEGKKILGLEENLVRENRVLLTP